MRFWRRNEDGDKGRQRGQGLVEFALMAPLLLMTLMGIADFGRMLTVYSNLFNAAREGARYGVVYPRDVAGVQFKVMEHINMIDPLDADIQVHFDSGPGTLFKNFHEARVGDRLLVTVIADVEMITPLMRVFAPSLRVETRATRTIATVHTETSGPIPAPPPIPTDTPIPVPPEAPEPTPTLHEGKAPIVIQQPLIEDQTTVTVSAQACGPIKLYDAQDPSWEVDAMGPWSGGSCVGDPPPSVGYEEVTFTIGLPAGKTLIANHVIVVKGYGTVGGAIDYAIVQPLPSDDPTPTPTMTPTPTVTPAPDNQYIWIDPACGPAGEVTIMVHGRNWPDDKGAIYFYWSQNPASPVLRLVTRTTTFDESITVNAPPGTHWVRVRTEIEGDRYWDAKAFQAPCPQPNLVVEQLVPGNTFTFTYTDGITTTEPFTTYHTMNYTVTVRNAGSAAAEQLFWVDLYADPAVQPPAPGDLAGEASVAWSAVDGLEPGKSAELVLSYREGVAETSEFAVPIYALADAGDVVAESIEADNVGGPVSVTVEIEGTPPDPTPPPGDSDGYISGSTWYAVDDVLVPLDRVRVYVYDVSDDQLGPQLVAQTLSEADGTYYIDYVAANDNATVGYMVVAEAYLGDRFISDVALDVRVTANNETRFVSLILH